MTRASVLLGTVLLTSCVGGYIKDVPLEFTFNFDVPGKTQAEIWTSARNHFATTYGDSRSVFQLQDQEQGLMIGKGVAPWGLALNTCLTSYAIRFGAKDGKAKVQYTLLEGVPLGSPCTGWPLPNNDGYEQIRAHLQLSAMALEVALKGSAKTDEFMDF